MSDSREQTDSTQEVATNFHILTPYPGTVLFKRLEAEGHILIYDWDQCDTAHVVFRPACMSVEEMERGLCLDLQEILFLGQRRLLGTSKHIAFLQRSSTHTLKSVQGSEGT